MHAAIRAAAGRPDWEEFERVSREQSWKDTLACPALQKQRSWDSPNAARAFEGLSPKRKAKRRAAQFTFNSADANCDEELERCEFTTAVKMMLNAGRMPDLDEELDAFVIDREFAEADTSKSGSLDLDEFAIWYNRFHDFIAERRLLRELDIDHAAKSIRLQGADQAAVLAVLRHCPSITKLTLIEVMLNNETLVLIAVRLRSQLTTLDLTRCKGFDTEGIKKLLADCCSLTLFKLSGCSDVLAADVAANAPKGCVVRQDYTQVTSL